MTVSDVSFVRPLQLNTTIPVVFFCTLVAAPGPAQFNISSLPPRALVGNLRMAVSIGDMRSRLPSQ